MVESNYSLSGCVQESPYHCGMSTWRWWSNTLWATLIRLWLHSSFGWSAGYLSGHRGWIKLQSIWVCSRVSVALCYVYFKVMVWQIVSNSHKVWLHSLLGYLQVVLGTFLCNFDRYIAIWSEHRVFWWQSCRSVDNPLLGLKTKCFWTNDNFCLVE
jgi:hypothetical protein